MPQDKNLKGSKKDHKGKSPKENKIVDVEFPLPQQSDGLLLIYLTQLSKIGQRILEEPTIKPITRQHGQFLMTIGTCPSQFPEMYFKIWEGSMALYEKFGNVYNAYIRQGHDKALQHLMNSIGDMEYHFNDIQVVFLPIHEKSKLATDKGNKKGMSDPYSPIGLILWTYYMSLWDKDLQKEFLDMVKDKVMSFASPEMAEKMKEADLYGAPLDLGGMKSKFQA